MARRRSGESESPTLPLPPPRSISLEQFVEVATGAALRALQVQGAGKSGPQPVPWHIWIGIIASQELPQFAGGARQAPRVAGNVAAQVGRSVAK
jgi:hypothetical protein